MNPSLSSAKAATLAPSQPSQALRQAVAVRRHRRVFEQPATQPVQRYRVDVAHPPINRYLRIDGPGLGLRFIRNGSTDFFNFAQIAKSLVKPGMSELDKALAVYRFSMRCFHGADIGFGNTDMTRFINCYGYSFCWGQADFQHLLYEAVGLQARAPQLPGHSSVEVLIDGKWRMMEAFMRLLAPSMELDGLATGAELAANPQRFKHIREGAVVDAALQYWASHGTHNTYEPWHHSHSMLLKLRRGESLRIGYARDGAWCLSPSEPPDYCNGHWTWRPIFDQEHLSKEIEAAENLVADGNRLRSQDPSRPTVVEYRLNSPYPLTRGGITPLFDQCTNIQVSISVDQRRSWTVLHEGLVDRTTCPVDQHDLSFRGRPEGGNCEDMAKLERRDILLRITWCGAATLQSLDFDFLVQLHAPSVPRLDQGVNQWAFLGGEPNARIVHAWDEYPQLQVSDHEPFSGEPVQISLTVHNRGPDAALNVPVRFVQAGTSCQLGEAVIPRIEAGGCAQASITWIAQAVGDRTSTVQDPQPKYVHTVIRAELDSDLDQDEWSASAEAVVTVRARPRAKFNDDLTWSSDDREAGEHRLILRAAVVHAYPGRDDGQVYVVPAGLSATVTPYLGHPDQGGLRLAPPQRLCDIQPTEFAVAEWSLDTCALPSTFTVWFEAVCDEPVTADSKRLLAQRQVRLG